MFGNNGLLRRRGMRSDLQVAVPCFKQAALNGLKASSAPAISSATSFQKRACWTRQAGSSAPCSSAPSPEPSVLLATSASVPSIPRVSTPVKKTKGAHVVRFRLTQNTEHEVTPYSQVYGKHPRLFNFDKNGHLARLEDCCFRSSPGSSPRSLSKILGDLSSPSNLKDSAGLPGMCMSPKGHWQPPCPFSPTSKLPLPPSPIAALRADWF